MERKLMIAPSMGCCDLFDMERQVRMKNQTSYIWISKMVYMYQALESDQNF